MNCDYCDIPFDDDLWTCRGCGSPNIMPRQITRRASYQPDVIYPRHVQEHAPFGFQQILGRAVVTICALIVCAASVTHGMGFTAFVSLIVAVGAVFGGVVRSLL